MNENTDKRTSPRLKHIAPVAVSWPSGARKTFRLQDFSDGGVFIQCDDADMPEKGARLTIQSLELEVAPIIAVEVVRLIPGQGFGARFMPETGAKS